jgi:hypothetical protein
MLDKLIADGDRDEAIRVIRRQARLVKAIQGLRPRVRRH